MLQEDQGAREGQHKADSQIVQIANLRINKQTQSESPRFFYLEGENPLAEKSVILRKIKEKRSHD